MKFLVSIRLFVSSIVVMLIFNDHQPHTVVADNISDTKISSSFTVLDKWWEGDTPVVRSVIRVRKSWSYSLQKRPVLDMWWVIIKQGEVHVWDPDAESIAAIEKSNYCLHGDSLRVNKGIKMIRIIVHKDNSIRSNEFKKESCSSLLYAQTSLFFLKPWFHENMYHLVNDATMLLFHKDTTPPIPTSSDSESSKNPISLFYDAKLLKFPTSHGGALPWTHEVFFASTAFPAGSHKLALSVINSEESICVGGLHWGTPLRVLSSHLAPLTERRAAVAMVVNQLFKSCPDMRVAPPRSSDGMPLKVIFVSRPGSHSQHNRKIANSTITSLVKAFKLASKDTSHFEVCCDFHKNSPCEMAQKFVDADIVIGMHGAGLANAVFSTKSSGSVLIELRTSFGKDLDIFSSLALGTGAGYMWVSMGEEEKAGALGGTTLPFNQTEIVANCAVHMLHMKRIGGEVDHTICKPIRGRPFDNKKPGLFGYTPIGYSDDICFKKRTKQVCYGGMRTSSFKPPSFQHIKPKVLAPPSNNSTSSTHEIFFGASHKIERKSKNEQEQDELFDLL